MTTTHTLEPWEIISEPIGYGITGVEHTPIFKGLNPNNLHDWERIVTCVNACSGLTNQQVLELPKIIDNGSVALSAVPKLIEQHLELINTLEYVLEVINKSEEWWIDVPTKGGFDRERIESAVKKAKGGNNE